MFNLINKRRYVILEERDVILMLKVIQDVTAKSRLYVLKSYEIGNCRCKEQPTKWFMHFNAPNKYWRVIIETLNKKGYEFVLDSDNNIYLTKRLES